MNELVRELTVKQKVECSRPEKSARALKECVDRNYVHILFTATGSELGVQLHRPDCALEEADFSTPGGRVRLVGGLTLNYNKVKCIAEIDLDTCEGEAFLEPVGNEEYNRMINTATAHE